MQSLEAALRRKDPDARIFFAPKGLRPGGLWPEVQREIAEATAFLLLIGEKGIGPWQKFEYYDALDRRVTQPDFPVVLILLDPTRARAAVSAANTLGHHRRPAIRKELGPGDGCGVREQRITRRAVATLRALSGACRYDGSRQRLFLWS